MISGPDDDVLGRPDRVEPEPLGGLGDPTDASATRPPWRERLRANLAVWGDVKLLLIGAIVLGMSFAEGSANDWITLAAVDGSLTRLGTDYIDVYLVHKVDVLTPIEETIEALEALVRQGKVRYVGFSNWPAWLPVNEAVL